MSHHRPWAGIILAAIGVIVLLAQIALYFYGIFADVQYQIYRPVSYLGIMLGFVGFYMIDRKGAEGGAGILTNAVVAIISVVRTGKRSGDAVSVEVTPVSGGKPDDSAKTTVTVPNPSSVADPATDAILAAEAAARREKHTAAPPVAAGEEG